MPKQFPPPVLFKHFIHILFFSLLIGSTASSQAQVEAADYEMEIAATLECQINRVSECTHSYRSALDMAKKTENDSIIGHCFVEIAYAQKKSGVNFEQRWLHLAEGVNQLKRSNEFCAIGVLYAEMGNVQLEAGEEDYLSYHDSAVAVMGECAVPSSRIRVHMAKSNGLQYSGDLTGSINQLLLADQVAKEVGDQTSIAQVNLGLGNVYALNEDYQLAKDSYKLAADITLAQGDSMRYWYSMISYCHAANSMEQPREAIQYLPSAVAHFKKLGYTQVVPYALSQLGHSHLLLEEYEKAIPYLKESSGICRKLNMKPQLAYNDLLLAKAYVQTGNLEKGLVYSTSAYDTYSTQHMPADLMDAAQYHAEVLKKSGQYAASLKVYEKFLSLRDSLYNESKMKAITALQGELELEQKESELCAAENNLTVMESKHEQARNKNILLVVALLLLAALAYALLNKQKLKTANERARVKEQEFENEKLSQEVAFKNRELNSLALNIAQKNEMLVGLKEDLKRLQKSGEGNGAVNDLVNKLRISEQIEDHWEDFTRQFTATNPTFYTQLNAKFPSLSKGDLRLAALLRMNLSSKDIARLLNISDDGVKKARQRIRKKLTLNSEDSLETYILTF